MIDKGRVLQFRSRCCQTNMAGLNNAMAVAVTSDAEQPQVGKFLRASKAFEPGVPQKNHISLQFLSV